MRCTKELRYPFGIILVVAMLLALAVPVFAISNPNYTAIDAAAVFSNVSSTGDQLWIVRYAVNYTTLPTDLISDTFLMAITSGTTTNYSVPLPAYGNNFVSIYLNSTQALTVGGSYDIKVMGNPLIFTLVEGVNLATRPVAISDYQDVSTLQSWLLGQIQLLQVANNTTYLDASNLLNTVGGTLMLNAIPGLNNIVPGLFSATTYYPTVDNVVFTYAGTSTYSAHKGTILTAALQDIGNWLGTNTTGGSVAGGNWIGLAITGFLAMMLGSVAFASSKSPTWSLAFASLSLPLAAWMGIFDLTQWVLIFVLLGIAFGVTFILARM